METVTVIVPETLRASGNNFFGCTHQFVDKRTFDIAPWATKDGVDYRWCGLQVPNITAYMAQNVHKPLSKPAWANGLKVDLTLANAARSTAIDLRDVEDPSALDFSDKMVIAPGLDPQIALEMLGLELIPED